MEILINFILGVAPFALLTILFIEGYYKTLYLRFFSGEWLSNREFARISSRLKFSYVFEHNEEHHTVITRTTKTFCIIQCKCESGEKRLLKLISNEKDAFTAIKNAEEALNLEVNKD